MSDKKTEYKPDNKTLYLIHEYQLEKLTEFTDELFEAEGLKLSISLPMTFSIFKKLYACWKQAAMEEWPESHAAQISEGFLAKCAQKYFVEHLEEKFRVSLIELMSESVLYSTSISAKESGHDTASVQANYPSLSELQCSTLTPSIARLNSLKVRNPPIYSKNEPERAIELVGRAIPSQCYDRPATKTLWYEVILSYMRKNFSHWPEELLLPFAATQAAHSDNFVWQNIEKGTLTMVDLLFEFATKWGHKLGSVESVGEQIAIAEATGNIQDATHLKATFKMIQPLSATEMHELAKPFLDKWFDHLSVELRGSGGDRRGQPDFVKEKLAEHFEHYIERWKEAKKALQLLLRRKRVGDKISDADLQGLFDQFPDLAQCKPLFLRLIPKRNWSQYMSRDEQKKAVQQGATDRIGSICLEFAARLCGAAPNSLKYSTLREYHKRQKREAEKNQT